MQKATIATLLATAGLIISVPLHAQAVTRPEQPPAAPEQAVSTAAAGTPDDMAIFVARVRKGMTGGKGSAQARKARVREIARQHAESRRPPGLPVPQGPPGQQTPPQPPEPTANRDNP